MTITGERIKELRLARGLTQTELGEAIGIKKSAIYKYETGRVRNIPKSKIEMLAQILKCPPSYLMDIEDETTKAYMELKDKWQNRVVAKAKKVPVLEKNIDGKSVYADETKEIFVEEVRSPLHWRTAKRKGCM